MKGKNCAILGFQQIFLSWLPIPRRFAHLGGVLKKSNKYINNNILFKYTHRIAN